MKKIRGFVLDKPWLYGLGVLVSTVLLVFGFSFDQAVTVLFWWYLTCAVTAGLYLVWCNFIALMMSLVDKDIPFGWNKDTYKKVQFKYADFPVNWKNHKLAR